MESVDIFAVGIQNAVNRVSSLIVPAKYCAVATSSAYRTRNFCSSLVPTGMNWIEVSFLFLDILSTFLPVEPIGQLHNFHLMGHHLCCPAGKCIVVQIFIWRSNWANTYGIALSQGKRCFWYGKKPSKAAFSGNIILSVKFGIFYKKTRKSSVISDDFLFRLFIAFFIFHAFSVFFSAIGT